MRELKRWVGVQLILSQNEQWMHVFTFLCCQQKSQFQRNKCYHQMLSCGTYIRNEVLFNNTENGSVNRMFFLINVKNIFISIPRLNSKQFCCLWINIFILSCKKLYCSRNSRESNTRQRMEAVRNISDAFLVE